MLACGEPIVGIALVQYTNYRLTLRCIKSINRHVEHKCKIFVCDNCSPDNSYENLVNALRTEGITNVKVIRNSTNQGYAAGVNICLNAAKTLEEFTYFWVLNNDCELKVDALSPLVEYITHNATNNTILGSVLLDTVSGAVQSAGGTHNRWLSYSKHMYEGARLDQIPEVVKPDYIVGASIFGKREALNDIGMMDEQFFLYCEDVEFSLRAVKKCYSLLVLKKSILHHDLGATVSSEAKQKGARKLDLAYLKGTILLSKKLGFPYSVTVRLSFSARVIWRVLNWRWKGAGRAFLAMLSLN